MSEPTISELANAKLASATRITMNTRTSSRLKQLPRPMSQLKNTLITEEKTPSSYTKFFNTKTLSDPIFGKDGILGFETVAGTVELYLNAAATALNTVDAYDSSAAQSLAQIIDYFAKETRALQDQKIVLEQNIELTCRDREKTYQKMILLEKENADVKAKNQEAILVKNQCQREYDQMHLQWLNMQKEVSNNENYHLSLKNTISQIEAELQYVRGKNAQSTKQNNYYHTELNELRTKFEQLVYEHGNLQKLNFENEKALSEALLQIEIKDQQFLDLKNRLEAHEKFHLEEVNQLHQENQLLNQDNLQQQQQIAEKEKQTIQLIRIKEQQLNTINSAKKTELLMHLETQRSLANLKKTSRQSSKDDLLNRARSIVSDVSEDMLDDNDGEIQFDKNGVQVRKTKGLGQRTNRSRLKQSSRNLNSQANLLTDESRLNSSMIKVKTSTVQTQTDVTLKDFLLLVNAKVALEKLVPNAKKRNQLLNIANITNNQYNFASSQKVQKQHEVQNFEERRVNLQQAMNNAKEHQKNYQQQLSALQKWMEQNPDKVTEDTINQMEQLKVLLINTNHDLEVLEGEYNFVKKQQIVNKFNQEGAMNDNSDSGVENEYNLDKNAQFKDQYGYGSKVKKQGIAQASFIENKITKITKIDMKRQFEESGKENTGYVDASNIQQKFIMLNTEAAPIIKGVFKNLAKMDEERIRYMKELQVNLLKSQKQQKLESQKLDKQAKQMMQRHLQKSKNQKAHGMDNFGIIVQNEEDIKNGKKIYDKVNNQYNNPFKEIIKNRSSRKSAKQVAIQQSMDNLAANEKKMDVQQLQEKIFNLIGKVTTSKQSKPQKGSKIENDEDLSSSEYYSDEYSDEFLNSKTSQNSDSDSNESQNNTFAHNEQQKKHKQKRSGRSMTSNFDLSKLNQSISPNAFRNKAASLLNLKDSNCQYEKAIFTTTNMSIFVYKNMFSFFDDFQSFNSSFKMQKYLNQKVIDQVSSLFYQVIQETANSKILVFAQQIDLQTNKNEKMGDRIYYIQQHPDIDNIIKQYNFSFQSYQSLQYAILPFNITLKSLTWILELCDQILVAIMDEFSAKSYQFLLNPHQNFSLTDFVIQYVKNIYGLDILVMNLVIHLIVNLIYFKSQHPRVELVYLLFINRVTIYQLQFLSYTYQMCKTPMQITPFKQMAFSLFTGISEKNIHRLEKDFEANCVDGELSVDFQFLLLLRVFSLENVVKNVKLVQLYQAISNCNDSEKFIIQQQLAPQLELKEDSISSIEDFLKICSFHPTTIQFSNNSLIELTKTIVSGLYEQLNISDMSKKYKRGIKRVIGEVEEIIEQRSGYRAWLSVNHLLSRWQEIVINQTKSNKKQIVDQ